jgi:hypothetical protein
MSGARVKITCNLRWNVVAGGGGGGGTSWAKDRKPSTAGHAGPPARRGELEDLLLAAPATDWVEAVAKARYLLILFAQSPAGEDARRATLIADLFTDFRRLLAEPKNPAVAGDAGLAPSMEDRGKNK